VAESEARVVDRRKKQPGVLYRKLVSERSSVRLAGIGVEDDNRLRSEAMSRPDDDRDGALLDAGRGYDALVRVLRTERMMDLAHSG
jgi:hypothetical protein